MYQKIVKRILDIVLSSVGILLASIPMLMIAVIIRIDSPGPVIFKQKRIGLHKSYFNILKFRTMPVTASSDVPTHLMNEEIKFTKWQRFMRKSSLDELPQLFCIFSGKMSFVGPRPALWNQDDLIEERDRYGANDVTPGLTGWAQIHGRDELEISVKARFDGDYCQALRQGGWRAFIMDLRCIFGSVLPVLRHDGVVDRALPNNDKS